jgi:hypothetical protein
MAKYKTKKKGRRKQRRQTPMVLAYGGVLIVLVALAVFIVQTVRSPRESAPPEFSGGPRLKVDIELVDLGPLPMDIPVMATFTLTNVGDETLRFTQKPYIEVLEGC